jgi:hypothetical protein
VDIIEKARAYAADKHADKKRKYTDQPYLNHLQAVVNTLQGAGVMEPPILAAAYLHDTVEDTDATIQDIIVEFGADVAELVYWLTDAEKGNRESRTHVVMAACARTDAGETHQVRRHHGQRCQHPRTRPPVLQGLGPRKAHHPHAHAGGRGRQSFKSRAVQAGMDGNDALIFPIGRTNYSSAK